MSAPAVTYFCENGHVVRGIPHGYMLEDDNLTCPYCESSNIKMIMEWDDPDYWTDGDMDAKVSHNPIDHFEHTIKIPVYDVSRLFGGK